MTDPRPRNTPPRISLSAREWKLFVIGGLGVVYAAGLGIVTTQTQSATSQPAAAVGQSPAGQGSFTSATTAYTAPATAARVPRILTRTS